MTPFEWYICLLVILGTVAADRVLEQAAEWINENPADSHESAGHHENGPVD